MMQDLLARITFVPGVLRGKPTVRGLRISVEMILDLLAKGSSQQEILQDYPLLEPEDIQAALFYARNLVASELVSGAIVVATHKKIRIRTRPPAV